jgi:hypothetical protein
VTKYVVTDANGKKHTRNSDRVYSHAVLYRDSKEHDLKWATTRGVYQIENFWHTFEIANGTSKWLEPQPWEKNHAERAAREIEAAKNALRGCKHPDELWELQKAEAVAAIEAKDYSVWKLKGFCGRRDLAEKLALQCRAAQVIILPVEVAG